MSKNRWQGLLSLCLAAALACSCGPQTSKPSKNSHKEILQPTPVFYPHAPGPYPAILVMPLGGSDMSGENNIARDLSTHGYVAKALGLEGWRASNIFKDAAVKNRYKQIALDDLKYLKSQPGVDPDRLGVIGYSLGGFLVTCLASSPDAAGLKAGVVYYGIYDVPDQIKNLQVPVLVFQGDDDFPEFVQHAAAMRQVAHDYKRAFEVVFYPRTRHGFDRRPNNPYAKAVAQNSWDRMIYFLNRNLKR